MLVLRMSAAVCVKICFSSFPRSAWATGELDALRPRLTPLDAERPDGIPTQSVGTRPLRFLKPQGSDIAVAKSG